MTMAEYLKSVRETPAEHAARIAKVADELAADHHARVTAAAGRWDR